VGWRAAFPGKFHTLFGSGKEIPVTNALRRDGNAETFSMIHVAPAETLVVRVASG